MRRPNGSGSVYKLQDKRRRRPWVAVAPQGYDSSGRLKRITLGYYEKRELAEEALVEWRKHPTNKLDLTLEDLFNEWFEPHCRDLSKSMRGGYAAAWQHLAQLKDERVRDIRTGQLQTAIDSIRVNEKNPSRSTLEKVKALLVLLLDYAEKNDIVSTNYAKFISLPKRGATTRTAFSDTELKKVETAVGTVPGAGSILVLCYTGLRLDEFLSMLKSAYDPETRVLRGGSKTDAGRDRTIPVSSKIQPIIDRWLQLPGEYLFARPDGGRYTQQYYRENIYKPALCDLGIPYENDIRKLTPHCTRHTFGSLLHTAGVDPVEIQKLMGHTDYALTANIYTHVDIVGLRKAVESI